MENMEINSLQNNSGRVENSINNEINFVSSKNDSDEIRTMHTKSNNVEIMIGSETDEIIKEIFESLLQNYRKDSEESVRGSDVIIDRKGRSYIDSPKWLKNKKATTNPKMMRTIVSNML